MSNSQSGQDRFIRRVLKEKRDGYFLEIGSNHPIQINNTYILESEYDWKGVMVEYEKHFEASYKEKRPNSIHVISDATQVDYAALFATHSFPKDMDYLQIDLEVENASTLNTLQLLDRMVLDQYRFAVVTFEHDAYRGDHHRTRATSREIFLKRGYCLVYPDVKNQGAPFEDWYVHPALVDMSQIHPTDQSLEWSEIPF